MSLLFDWWLTDLVSVVVGLLAALYLYMSLQYSYWKKRGVPFLEPRFPFGNLGDTMSFKKHFGLIFSEFYTRLEGHKLGGVFQLHRPTLVLRDPNIIRSVLIKGFANFHDRGIYYDEKNDPLSAHLFVMSGQKWKNLRSKVTPTFTSGKMKMMFEIILECGQQLSETVREAAKLNGTIETKDIISRYSTDVIASCAFGIQCNCLKNPEAEFRAKGRQFFEPKMLTSIGIFMYVMVPRLGAILKLGNTPKNLSDFFQKVVKETIEHREKNNITRNDFMQLLMQLKNRGYVDRDVDEDNSEETTEPEVTFKLTLKEVSAQAFVFFIAGFETSSTTASFCLYELALNPDIQTRLVKEMNTVLARNGGQLTYEAMHEMEYLTMVLAETLRKYPPVPILHRECNTAFTIPESGLVVEPGTPVVVPVYALHHDPQYYPDPDKFDPERFTTKQKALRKNYTYLPFGDGPRICIGMRFAYMQIKVALVSLLTRYEFRISEKMTTPFVFDTKIFTLSPEGGMYLEVVERSLSYTPLM